MKSHLNNLEAKKLLRNKKVIEEINRHKWLESEIAGYDIGFEAAAEDWLKKHAAVWIAYHANKNKSLLNCLQEKASCQVTPSSLKNINEFPCLSSL